MTLSPDTATCHQDPAEPAWQIFLCSSACLHKQPQPSLPAGPAAPFPSSTGANLPHLHEGWRILNKEPLSSSPCTEPLCVLGGNTQGSVQTEWARHKLNAFPSFLKKEI